MPTLKLEEWGFYKSIKFDEQGLPVEGEKLTGGVLPPGLKQFVFHMAMSGDPGTYRVTIDVKSYHEQPGFRLDYPSHQITVRPGGSCHLSFPVDIEPLPMGRYEITVNVEDRPLLEFAFNVGN